MEAKNDLIGLGVIFPHAELEDDGEFIAADVRPLMSEDETDSEQNSQTLRATSSRRRHDRWVRARRERSLEILRAERPPAGKGAAALIGPNRDISETRLAKDHLGDIHLLVRLPQGRASSPLPLGEVLPADWLDEEDGDVSLDVKSTDSRLTPTFLSLVGEMLSRVDDSGKPCIDELMHVLSSWREALAREQRGLSRQRAIGLFGELSSSHEWHRRIPAAPRRRGGGKRDTAMTFSSRTRLR